MRHQSTPGHKPAEPTLYLRMTAATDPMITGHGEEPAGVIKPIPRRPRIVAVLAGMALLMAAGCGSARPSTGPPSTAPSGAATPAVAQAANLTRAEADPCRLLSEKQAARLGVGDGTLARSSEAMNGQACRLTNFPDKPVSTPGKFYLVQLLDNPGDLASNDNTVTPIAEFPTKRGTPSGSTSDNTCVDVVDLDPASNPSRYLWVQFADLARDNPLMSHQMACRNASVAAVAAIKSLGQT